MAKRKTIVEIHSSEKKWLMGRCDSHIHGSLFHVRTAANVQYSNMAA